MPEDTLIKTTLIPAVSTKKVKLKSDGQLPENIKKGHELLYARQDLSIHEQNLFNLMVAHMSPEQWKDNIPYFEFRAAHLSDWLGIDSKNLSSALSPVADRLAKKTFGFANEETKEFDYMPLFKRIRYKDAKLVMIPNDELKAEYMEYSSGFALVKSKSFFRLSHSYTKRLYEILSRFKDERLTKRYHTIEELQGLLGVLDEKGKIRSDKKSLDRPSVFLKRCIIEPLLILEKECSDELILLTDDKGNKGFIPIKKGRSIISLKFNYRWVSNQIELDVVSAKSTIRELENRRLMKGEILTESELEMLAAAYLKLGNKASAEDIYKSLNERINPQVQESNHHEEDIDIFLQRIDMMKQSNPDTKY